VAADLAGRHLGSDRASRAALRGLDVEQAPS